jgi:hypothetical protein
MPKNYGPIGGPNWPNAGHPHVLSVVMVVSSPLIAHVTYSEPVVVLKQPVGTGIGGGLGVGVGVGGSPSPLLVSGMTLVSITEVGIVPSQLHFTFSQGVGGPQSLSFLPWSYADDSPVIVTRQGHFPIRGMQGRFPQLEL